MSKRKSSSAQESHNKRVRPEQQQEDAEDGDVANGDEDSHLKQVYGQSLSYHESCISDL